MMTATHFQRVSDRALVARWIAVLLLSAGALTTAQAAASPLADSLHAEAWDLALNEAAHNPAQAFAFYAYRTLAVPHPEIYLLADSLFSGIVETLPGSRLVYRGSDPRDIQLFRRIQRREQEGAPFRWRHWSPMPDSIADDGAGFVSWLDRRLPSCAVLLRAESARLSTLEAASLRYTALRRGGESPDSLFVIVDAQGGGHIWRNSTLYSAATGQPASADPSGINPVIVFNESLVYYPLLGRDDRPASSYLDRAVSRLGNVTEPALTPHERRQLDRLQSVASLTEETSRHFAVLAALGATAESEASLRQLVSRCFPDESAGEDHLGFVPGMIREVLYHANHLSVSSAKLAALAIENPPFDRAAPQISSAYLDLSGRRVNPGKQDDSTRSAWGYLWSYDLLDIGFDDIIRTRAGRGSSQALAMSAILDLAGLPNVRVEVDIGASADMPDQHWVLSPDGRWQYNSGVWNSVPAQSNSGKRFTALLVSLGVGSDWIDFGRSDLHCDWEYLAVAQELAHVAAAMPAAMISIPQPLQEGEDVGSGHGHHHGDLGEPRTVVPLGEYSRRLAADEIHWEPIPWPGIGLVNPRKSEIRN